MDNMQKQMSSIDGDKNWKNKNEMLANKSIVTEMAETLNGLIRSDRIRRDPVKNQ